MSDASEVHARLKDFWDADAATYDHTPNHAVSDPVERAAWRAILGRLLPPAPARVLDAGAGTGAMSLLAAELGHRVTALDLSPGMLEKLSAKAAQRGLDVEIVTGPADRPPPGPFDAIVERHVVWTLPDPTATLAAWRDAAAPNGRLISFEGRWGQTDPVTKLRRRAAKTIKAAMRAPGEHHGSYEPDLLDALPLARGVTAEAILAAVEDAGWRAARIERMRDVEWAREQSTHPALRPFQGVALFAIVADA